MIHRCPHCGRTSDEAGPTAEGELDAQRQAVLVDGTFRRLTPQEFAIATLLHARLDMCLAKEAIWSALYGARLDQPDPKIVDVYVCKLRKKLQGSNYAIETVWGRGYRMVRASAPAAQQVAA